MAAMLAPRPPRLSRVTLVVAAIAALLALAVAVGIAALAPSPALAAGAASLIAASDPVVGQVDTFWVKDWNGGGYLQVEAEVAQVGDSCVVYVERRVRGSGHRGTPEDGIRRGRLSKSLSCSEPSLVRE